MKTTLTIIAEIFTILGTLFSIFLAFRKSPATCYVALCVLLVCAVFLVIVLSKKVNNTVKESEAKVNEAIKAQKESQDKLLEKIDTILEGTSSDTDHDGFETKTVFLKFVQKNSSQSSLDNYKVIQSKRLFLKEAIHEYQWTGSKEPDITSSLQDIGEITKGKRKKYDSVLLKLTKDLPFNGTTTLHVHQEMDDPDGKAKPYLCYKVREDQRINLIIFNAILKNKSRSSEIATLSRMRISNTASPDGFEILQTICFDVASKSFFHELVDPEPGYYYKLEWKK